MSKATRFKSEAALAKRIRDWLRQNGIWCEKIHGGPNQRAGLPDLLVLDRGRAMWIECKMPGKHPTKLQEQVSEEMWRMAGVPVCVAHDLDEFAAAWWRWAGRELEPY